MNFTLSYRPDILPEVISSDALIYQKKLVDFPLKGSKITFTNSNKSKLYATLLCRGVPIAGNEIAASNGIEMITAYLTTGTEDTVILDETSIIQGSDFVASVKVTNTSEKDFENLVLTSIFPSGWQIHNSRFSAGGKDDSNLMDYQDIRDDRIYSYFSLEKKGSKTFDVLLNASYPGKYYLPGIHVEAMYDTLINANTIGTWVDVEKN